MLLQRLFSFASMAALISTALAKPVVVKGDSWEVPEAVRPLNHLEVRNPMAEARSQYLEKRLSGEVNLRNSWVEKSLFSSSVGGVSISARCVECHIDGTVSVDLSNENLINPVLRMDFVGVKAWIELGLIVTGGKTFTLNLYTSQSPIGIGFPGLNVGVLLFVDLVLDVDAEIDITGGFYVELANNSFIEAALLKGELEQTAFKGVGIQSIPVKVKHGDVMLTAALRVRVQAGVEADVIGTSAVVAVYANIIEFVLNLQVTAPNCYLEATEHFNVNIGAYADVELLFFDIAGPTASTTLYNSPTLTQCLIASKPASTGTLSMTGGVIGGNPSAPASLVSEYMSTTAARAMITPAPVNSSDPYALLPGALAAAQNSAPVSAQPIATGNSSDPYALLPGAIGVSKTLLLGSSRAATHSLHTGSADPYALLPGALGVAKSSGAATGSYPAGSNSTGIYIASTRGSTIAVTPSAPPAIIIKSYNPGLVNAPSSSALSTSTGYGINHVGPTAIPGLDSKSFSSKATDTYPYGSYTPSSATSTARYPAHNATLTAHATGPVTGIPYGTAGVDHEHPPIGPSTVVTMTICAVHVVNCPPEFAQLVTVTKALLGHPEATSLTTSTGADGIITTTSETPTGTKAPFVFPAKCTPLIPLEVPIVNIYVPPLDAVIPDSPSLNIIDYGYEQIIQDAAGNETTVMFDTATPMPMAIPTGGLSNSAYQPVPKIKEYNAHTTSASVSASAPAITADSVVLSSALNVRHSLTSVLGSFAAVFAIVLL
ncbi:hypothetical protein BROUX41_003930 [Berkeleyomyces rouxiae]|uniref:uncharacterized protein n=1 Tax=Berkeleyomyces rouxiae TaxID=2035830 RepID=UPI003B7BF1AC